MDLVNLHNLHSSNGLPSTEAYLQGLSVGLATLGGSDGWLRFILDPSMDEAGKKQTVQVAMIDERYLCVINECERSEKNYDCLERWHLMWIETCYSLSGCFLSIVGIFTYIYIYLKIHQM